MDFKQIIPTKLFLGFLIIGVAGILYLHNHKTFANSSQEVSGNVALLTTTCTALFTPDPDWSNNYPSCVVTPSVDGCEATPMVSFSGVCYPDIGEIVVGEITVYDGTTPIYLYEVKVVDGTGIIILIEEL